ncbi:MAG: PadR family transcriptional regulator, partial [Nitratireductor sp.]
MTRTPTSLRSVSRPAPDYTDPAYWQGTIKMSLSKFFVLSVLHHRPMHGYEIVQAVEKTTNGCCSPTEGTVYPMLNEFE